MIDERSEKAFDWSTSLEFPKIGNKYLGRLVVCV